MFIASLIPCKTLVFRLCNFVFLKSHMTFGHSPHKRHRLSRDTLGKRAGVCSACSAQSRKHPFHLCGSGALKHFSGGYYSSVNSWESHSPTQGVRSSRRSEQVWGRTWTRRARRSFKWTAKCVSSTVLNRQQLETCYATSQNTLRNSIMPGKVIL